MLVVELVEHGPVADRLVVAAQVQVRGGLVVLDELVERDGQELMAHAELLLEALRLQVRTQTCAADHVVDRVVVLEYVLGFGDRLVGQHVDELLEEGVVEALETGRVFVQLKQAYRRKQNIFYN